MNGRVCWLLIVSWGILPPLRAEPTIVHVHSDVFAAHGVAIAPVRPADAAVSVKNGASKPISRINLRYRISPGSGSPDRFSTYQLTLPQRLAPGEQIAVPPAPDAGIESLSREYPNATISVSVDSVIFVDGLVIGPDEIDVVRQAENLRAGRLSVLREFVHRSAASPESIPEWLQSVSRNPARRDDYQQGAAAAARDLIFLMGRLRRDQWVPSVQLQLAAPPPPPFTRLPQPATR